MSEGDLKFRSLTIVIGVAALLAGCGTSSSSDVAEDAPRTTKSASTAEIEPASASEIEPAEWRVTMASFMLTVANAIDDFTVATADPVAVFTSETTQASLVDAVGRLEQCAVALEQQVPPAPTPELQEVAERMDTACVALSDAVRKFALGLGDGLSGEGGEALLDAANEIDRATALFREAQNLLDSQR